MYGGGHEQGIRSGTLSVHNIVGFGTACEIAKKNKLSEEQLKRIVEIDSKTNKIIVSLSNKGGYSFKYFPDYFVSSDFKENQLILNIKEKEVENENSE